MLVLGSTYLPMMDAIRGRLPAGTRLRPYDARCSLERQIGEADVLLLGHQHIAGAQLAAAPRLRLIQQHGRGVDSVDLLAARKRGVTVANVPGGNSVAVAEHSLALMLALAKQLHRAPSSIARRRTGEPMGMELRGKTLGIIGLGASGSQLALLARALGMRVMAIRRNPGKPCLAPVDFLGGPDQLDAVLGNADVVVLLATPGKDSNAMLGIAQLRTMKRTAFLVNTGRAQLVDRVALHTALLEGAIAGAAFDVFWEEPADPGDALLAMDNFILTPHMAGFTDAAIAHISASVATNIERLRDGLPLFNVVEG